MNTNIATPLGQHSYNAAVGADRAMQVRSANPLRDLNYTDAEKDKFIRAGHVLMKNFRSALIQGGEVCRADAKTASTLLLLAGVSIVNTNVIPGQGLQLDSTSKTWKNPDTDRATYVIDNEVYVIVDHKAPTAILAGVKIEVTDMTDDASLDNEIRYGTVVDVADNDTNHAVVGYAVEDAWNYIPKDKMSYFYNSGSGIKIVKVRLSDPVPITTS